jgi:hypothetical protein
VEPTRQDRLLLAIVRHSASFGLQPRRRASHPIQTDLPGIQIVPLPPPLSHPARYFPFQSGRYEIAPGLSRFGRDFGNGIVDDHVFQFDSAFSHYRAEKERVRNAKPGHHVLTADVPSDVAATVVPFIVHRLVQEHPDAFALARNSQGSSLQCHLTGETIHFDNRWRLSGASGHRREAVWYSDAIDAIASQVQEDLAILTIADGSHKLAAAHICFPNGWAPEQMIGRDFAGLHHAVPGMGAMNARAADFARLMLHSAEGMVRFAWGISFDDRLDHHPSQPRSGWESGRPAAWLRVERQTIWGFPEDNAALFTIRTYIYDVATSATDPGTRGQLISAIRSMSPESLAYKGLATNVEALLNFLQSDRCNQ